MKKFIKPKTLSGFRDYNQKEAIIRDRLISIIKKVYESFGFAPIETPALEKTETLVIKESASDMILFRTSLVSGKKILKKDSGSLRFDLTVPLSRFIAANQDLIKPLKIYQIGKVWRGERHQKGRFKEFLQIDADILGSSSMIADSEIITIIYETLKKVGLNEFVIKINNRKILNQLAELADFKKNKTVDVLKILDKLNKIGETNVKRELKKIKINNKSIAKIFNFIKINGSNEEKLNKAMILFKNLKEAEEGIIELKEIIQNLRLLNLEEKYFEINFSIIRGLDYYTGPIFETYLINQEELGSVMAGGRYDNLISKFSNRKIPAVGVSLGFDRLFSIIETTEIGANKKSITDVLILWLDSNLKNEYLKIASKIRSKGINAEIYLGNDKSFNSQINYAIKREIPIIILFGAEEMKNKVIQIKNLNTRQQWQIQSENLIEEIKKQLNQ